MTATPEEIAATPIELWTSCSWRRFHFAYPGRGPFAEPIKQRTDDHPDIWFSGGEATGRRMAACWNACLGMADPVSEIAEMRATIERQAAEIERLRSIIGDTVWCHACGSLVPLDDPTCDCMDEDQQNLHVYDRETTEAGRAKVIECGELKAEIERLRAGAWRPIETAPKDGTEVLLWDGYESVIGFWWCGRQFLNSPMSEFWSNGPVPCNGYDAGMNQLREPTHWQPLPPPPSTSAGEG